MYLRNDKNYHFLAVQWCSLSQQEVSTTIGRASPCGHLMYLLMKPRPAVDEEHETNICSISQNGCGILFRAQPTWLLVLAESWPVRGPLVTLSEHLDISKVLKTSPHRHSESSSSLHMQFNNIADICSMAFQDSASFLHHYWLLVGDVRSFLRSRDQSRLSGIISITLILGRRCDWTELIAYYKYHSSFLQV